MKCMKRLMVLYIGIKKLANSCRKSLASTRIYVYIKVYEMRKKLLFKEKETK